MRYHDKIFLNKRDLPFKIRTENLALLLLFGYGGGLSLTCSSKCNFHGPRYIDEIQLYL